MSMSNTFIGGYKIINADSYQDNTFEIIKSVKVAILIHLFYTDTIPDYFKYIKNIPIYCTKIFTYSNDNNLRIIKEELEINNCSENCVFIQKNNRGRDISALLVAARDELKKYDIFGFLHDKKSHSLSFKEDTQKWIEELWINTVGSQEYILNVISTFYKHQNIGVLFPPYPFEGKINYGAEGWGNENIDITITLARRLDIKTEISKSIDPCAVGTMFWARTKALDKLLKYPWKYEDFSQEPMASMGTISHAVERVIKFVSIDAGFQNFFCINSKYAPIYLEKLYLFVREQNKILVNNFNISDRNVNFYEQWMKDLRNNLAIYQNIYIYGAGHYGIQCLEGIRRNNREPKAFLVSPGKDHPVQVRGIPICIFNKDFILPNSSCIIIAIEREYCSSVLDYIRSKLGYENMKNVFIYQSV